MERPELRQGRFVVFTLKKPVNTSYSSQDGIDLTNRTIALSGRPAETPPDGRL